MLCSIILSENKQRFENVQSIILPALSGELQILPGHAESFIALRQGKVILGNGKINAIQIEDGICHIKDDIATIIL